MNKMIEPVHLLLVFGIICSAGFALLKRDLLKSVNFMSIIGAGLATAVYVIAIQKTSRWEDGKE
jgi:uncharacterized MnhB-related membrane protein